jgi:GDP-4-dehydro-6-deoxy-D-mannose reductase
MNGRILVTGASGALGRAVVAQLRRQAPGSRLFTPGRRQADAPLDLRCADQIAAVLARCEPDWILHLAATFSERFEEAYAVNVAAARHLLEGMRHGGRPVRLLLVGSAAEYGSVAPSDNPVCESQVLRPQSIYGLTKAWQSELAGLYSSWGLDVRVARIFNLTGAQLSPQVFVGQLHHQIAELQRGERDRIEVGPLTSVRDFLPIDCAVRQLLAIAAHGAPGEVYHVASGTAVLSRDLLQRELQRCGLVGVPVVEATGLADRHRWPVPAIVADMGRTSTLLRRAGLSPQALGIADAGQAA